MSKNLLLLAPFLVAISLLLALPRGAKAADITTDLEISTLELNEPKPSQPHFMWQREAKITYVIEIKPVAKPKPAVLGATSSNPEISSLITKYASLYGADVQKMLVIAKCESGFRADAVSPSGTYTGMYQFNSTTWASNRRAMGLDTSPTLRTNAEEAIKTAAFKMGRDGYAAWPQCSKKA